MYKNILITLENSSSDNTIIDHIKQLAHGSSAHLLLLHVADGWAARHYNYFGLRESEEIKEDNAYLNSVADSLRKEGFVVDCLLKMGDPANEIIKAVQESQIDLVAMATHGHGFFYDLIYGSTADTVRHNVDVPVLLLRARK